MKHSKALEQSTDYVAVLTWEGPWCLPGDKRRPQWLQSK